MDSAQDSVSNSVCDTTRNSIIHYASGPMMFNLLCNIYGADLRASDCVPETAASDPPATKRSKVDPRMAAQMGHYSLQHFNNRKETGSKSTSKSSLKCKKGKAQGTPQSSTTESTAKSPSTICNVVKELKSKFPTLTVESHILDKGNWVIVHGTPNMALSIDSPIYTPRMVISVNAENVVCFKFEALFITIAKGVLPADQNQFYKYIQSLCPDSKYFICEGIPYEMVTLMDYQTKNMRKWDFPFQRLDHNNCEMWVQSGSVNRRCYCCSNLMYYINRGAKKQQSVTPEEKAARVNPSSHFPIKFLSPADQQERRNSATKDRRTLQRQVKRLGNGIDNEQHVVNVEDTTDGNTS